MKMNYIEMFTSFLTIEEKQPLTISTYCRDVNFFLEWWKNEKDVSFSPEKVSKEDLLLYMKSQGSLSPETKNKKIAILKSFFSFALEKGYIKTNPAQTLKTKRSVDQELSPEWLEWYEQDALLRVLDLEPNEWIKNRDRALVVLMLHTGLRVSEVEQLMLQDIEVNWKSLVVRQGKGNKLRHIPLNEKVKHALQLWYDIRIKRFSSVPTSSALFLSIRKTPLKKRSIQRIIEKYGHLANISNLHCHRLRHSFCKNLIDRHVPLTIVSKLAGHSSLQTTSRYTQPSRRDLEDAVSKLT